MSQPLGDAALDQLFRTARTYNGYLDKPVSTAQLHAIWDLMKFGPTSANMLPARLVWCTSDEAKAKLAACCLPANAEKVLKAPVTVIIGMDLDYHEQLPWLFPHTDARSWFVGNQPLIDTTAFRNATLQGAYLLLAARAIGLDCGPMSGFDNAKVDAEFFAPSPQDAAACQEHATGCVKSNFLCNIGYGDPKSIFPRSPRLDFDEACKLL